MGFDFNDGPRALLAGRGRHEYWSEEAGTNVWGTSREAFLRMTVAEDRVLSLDEWTTRIDKEGFTGERGYNHGYAFGRWLKTAVGAEAMARAEVARSAGMAAGRRWSRATGRTSMILQRVALALGCPLR